MRVTQASKARTRPGSGIASRYRALLMTHRSLDEKLEAELKRPMPDTAIVRRIKRRKLSIKDELGSMQRLFEAMGTKIEPVTMKAGALS